MKRMIVASLWGALLTASAWAQEAAVDARFKMTAEGKAQIELSSPVAVGTWIELKTVKGAPYSATAESETIQLLTDGNRIRNKTTTNIARDSEGRTRREMLGSTPGVPASVFINDPVSDARYSLNPKQRTATKVQTGGSYTLVEKKAVEGDAKAKTLTLTVDGAGGKVMPTEEANRAALELKLRQAKEATAVSGQAVAVGGFGSGGVMVKRKNPGTTEALGQQTIEGVLCEGKRTTITIAAGTIGNDLPINIVSEEWYSPELQVLVLTKHSDPRHGETIYRLTNIVRSEPARALFEVPSDYTVQEAARPMMKKVPKEDQ